MSSIKSVCRGEPLIAKLIIKIEKFLTQEMDKVGQTSKQVFPVKQHDAMFISQIDACVSFCYVG